MMTIKSLYALLQLLLFISAAINSKPASNPHEVKTTAVFARLKSLAGEWRSVGPNGEHSRLVYQVISGGSAVMERFSSDALPPNSGDMITIYYVDRGDLVLTHYCIAHNQPHMRATLYDDRTGELNFDFVAGGNMSSGDEGHMHNEKLRFIDDDHLSSEWEFTEVSQFTRVMQ
jgi:hypothetical protein